MKIHRPDMIGPALIVVCAMIDAVTLVGLAGWWLVGALL